MKYIKISRDIVKNGGIYPENPKNKIIKINDRERDGFETHMLKLFTHNGTHIETPRHFIEGEDITGYPIDSFVFDRVQITDYYDMKLEKKKDLLLIKTGYKRNTKNYPYITLEMAEKIVQYDYRCVGTDMISIGNIGYKEESERVHKTFFEKEFLILEDLDLSDVEMAPKKVFAIPLFVKDIEASPCTVFVEV